MSSVPAPHTLETDRLILRPRRVDQAVIYRQLWAERDPRVPPHRQIDPEGRPTVEEIAAQIRTERAESGPGILSVERKDAADVIGYCGLVFPENGAGDEPELAYELLRAAHGCGYATEAVRAVVTWANEAGYQRLWARVRDWNAPSRRVLEKLGFRETGRVERDAVHGESLLTVREFGAMGVLGPAATDAVPGDYPHGSYRSAVAPDEAVDQLPENRSGMSASGPAELTSLPLPIDPYKRSRG